MDANKSKEREEYKEKMYQYRIRGQIDLSIFMNCKKIVKKLKNYADTMPHEGQHLSTDKFWQYCRFLSIRDKADFQ